MNKKAIIIVLIVVVVVFGVYQAFFKKEKPNFTLADVSRGTITQEISESGQVQKGDKINLTFKNAGRIEKIYVVVGEEVKRGDVLAKLETTDLQIQLSEAESSLAVAQAKLNKLLAGATAEEIQAVQTKVDNAQISLNTANRNFEDAYEDALIVLEDAYLKAYNSQNTVATIQRTYFITADQAGVKVKENKEALESAVAEIKTYLDSAKTDPNNQNIDINLALVKGKLYNVSDYLKNIRETCEDVNYRNVVSSTDKTLLDTHRTNINTAFTNIVNSQQAIAAAKLAVDSAAGQLQVAKDSLAITSASPRSEDISLYQAQVSQAEAQVNLYQNQISQARIVSPADGQISKINKKVGELVQPVLQDVVMTIVPAAPYKIEVDVYEEDIVEVNIDNPVEISLIAFPDKTFTGRVVSIDPAEKVVDGVVYYEVTINFDETPEGIKPGMTADVVIRTAEKENVLTVPKDAVQTKDGQKTVEVFKDNDIEERQVEIGLKGSNDMVEIVSGLQEGEKVILR